MPASFASSSATFGVTGTDNNTTVTQGGGFLQLHEQGVRIHDTRVRVASQTVSSTFSSTGWG